MKYLIIDTNTLSLFTKNKNDLYAPILKSISQEPSSAYPPVIWLCGSKKGLEELSKVRAAFRLFTDLRINKKAELRLDARLEDVVIQWEGKKSQLKSNNDEWVLALAEVSGCRLLLTEDQLLVTDFKDHLTPRGKIVSESVLSDDRKLRRLLSS